MDPFSATQVIVGGVAYYIASRARLDNVINTGTWNLSINSDMPMKASARLLDLGNGQAYRLITIDNHMHQTIKDYEPKDVVFM